MFSKGTMKDEGVDITLKNNPDHVLSPNDWDKVLDARFGKMPFDKYKTWYLNLIRDRWNTRQGEFMELAKEGVDKEVKLCCFCPTNSKICHAHLASEFMNKLVEKLKVSADKSNT